MPAANRYGGHRVRMIGSADRLPLEVEVRGRGTAVAINLAAALAVMIFAAFAGSALPLNAFGEHEALARRLVPLAVFALGLLLAIRALALLFGRATIHVGPDEVRVKRRTLLGRREWREPLDAFLGVRWSRFAIRERRGETGRTRTRFRNVLELAHPDPSRSVPLVVHETGRGNVAATLALAQKAMSADKDSEQEQAALREEAERLGAESSGGHLREQWEALASALNRPAIDARDGVETVRAVEDLDKSIGDLAAEGRLDLQDGERAEGGDAVPPPPSLELQSSGEGAFSVILRKPQNPMLIYAFGGVGGITFLLGAFTLDLGVLFFGLIFAAVAAFLVYPSRTHPRRLDVADGELRYEDTSSKRASFTLPLDSIESIEIRDRDGPSAGERTIKLQGRELLISSDRGEHPAGAGLPEPALRWLRQRLVAAAARR